HPPPRTRAPPPPPPFPTRRSSDLRKQLPRSREPELIVELFEYRDRILSDQPRVLALVHGVGQDLHHRELDCRVRGDAPVSAGARDRKSTRLNSSHQIISYAVFCLK